MESEVENTATITEKLSKTAKTSPQNAYTKGVEKELSFLTISAFKKMDEIEKIVSSTVPKVDTLT